MSRIIRPAAARPVQNDVRATLQSILESAQHALVTPDEERAKWSLFRVATIAGSFASRWRWRRAAPVAPTCSREILRGPGSETACESGRDALSSIRHALVLADVDGDEFTLRWALAEIEEVAARFTARWPVRGQKQHDVTKIG